MYLSKERNFFATSSETALYQVFANLLEEVLKYKGEMRRQLCNPVSVKGGGNLVNLDVKPRTSAALSEEVKRVIRSEIRYFLLV